MCGIAGVLRPPDKAAHEPEIRGMLERIAHRGPDGSGVFVDRNVGLGHVRLAILDLSDNAAQPMVSRDGRFALSFNGEIYNFRDLRKKLEQRDIRLRSTGDTEVLLELLATFGVEETLPTLEGFFAFALWDKRDGSLVLARDRHGIKPLYFRERDDGSVLFASEMKPLISDETPPDPPGIGAALLGWSCVSGQQTLFRGIRQVEPGHWVELGPGREPVVRPFFQVSDFIDPGLYEDLERASSRSVVARLAAAFESSINLRLISDAPVACLASGGVDSNLAAAAAIQQSSQPIPLYHADVEHNSERPWAEQVARHLGAELCPVEVSDRTFLDNVPVTTLHAEIPLIYHTNSVPFYLVCRRAAQDGIKVVLTGEGSDEYFLGYPWIIIDRYRRPLRKAVAASQDLAHRVFPRGAGLLWPKAGESPTSQLARLLFRFGVEDMADEIRSQFRHVSRNRDREFQELTMSWVRGHLLTLLHRNDRLGMASGIESRFPFLGHDLARLAVNLPGRYKIRITRRFFNIRHPFHMDKWSIRRLAEPYLPDELVYRPKKGFPVSIENRLRIDPQLFHDGCIQEWFGIDSGALRRMPERTSPEYMFWLLLVEVWGQVMWRHCAVDDVRGRLQRHVEVQPV